MTTPSPISPASSATGEIPTLPANATPEEKDLHWFRYHYQGDNQRQLTLRAVLIGGVLGMLMSVANLYASLKLGWSFGVAITACVLSYVIWNAMRALSGNRLSRMTMLENNCMQSTASAAGMSTGGTLPTAFGALLLMAPTAAVTSLEISPWYVLVPFIFLTAALGVFLAIPLKRQMINHEQLAFPSGIAAAETLRSLYSEGREAMQKATALIIAMSVGAVVALLRGLEGLTEVFTKVGKPQEWLKSLTERIGIPETLNFPAWMAPVHNLKLSGFAFEPGVLMIGAGMIIGLRVALSMLLGSVLLYFVVVPWLVAHDQAAAGVAGYVPSFTIANDAINPIRWALWGGTTLMVAASLTSTAMQWRSFLRAFRLRRHVSSGGDADALAAIEVPNSWFIAGLVPICIGLVILQYCAFNVSIFLGIVAVLLSGVVALVCCRATGETDTTPVGPMGKVTQLLYAVLPGAKGNATINLMSAGVTAAAGSSAADLLTDLKSGWLLGANPRRQFIAQFSGVFFGTLAIIPAWYLMVPNRAALEAFNPPATNMWKAVADLLTKGIHMLPVTACWAIAIGGIVGIAMPLFERLFPRIARYMPSPIGLGLAWIMSFQNALSFAIGAVIATLWVRWHRKSGEKLSIPIASGLVAGESLVAAFIAIACTVIGLALKP